MFKRLLFATLIVCAAPLFGQYNQDIIGVTHVGGKYNFTTDHYLREGADRIRNGLGSRVIKLWLGSNPGGTYPFNSPLWPPAGTDPVTTLNHQYFRDALGMSFTSVVIVIDGVSWFNDGLSAAEEAAEEDLFYRLARHLMQNYTGTYKKFVLQNWEGDWQLRQDPVTGQLISDWAEPSAVTIDGMRRWLKARQRGVTRARNDFGSTYPNVTVSAAAEVNHLVKSKFEPHRVSVTNNVLRDGEVVMDLYSYSAWDSGDNATLFTELLTYLDNTTVGARNVYVGEYGAAENQVGSAEHLDRVKRFTEAGLSWGAVYMIYWEVFCNERVSGTAGTRPVNSDMAGFWLVRPDATISPIWDYYRTKWGYRRRACCTF